MPGSGVLTVSDVGCDIARAHGGNVILEKSPLGGLRATIRLPI